MPKIFALLVGVGEYPNPDHHLDGPKQDVKLMQEVLKMIHSRKNVIVKSKVLKEEKATRQNIIKGFKFFNQAKADDICLFFYSGHGSRVPGAMFSDQQNGLIESIVCHDSRLPGGLDLADKELAHLSKTNITQGVSLITVMDCCNSGQNMRGKFIREKSMPDANTVRSIEAFEGWETYSVLEQESQKKYSVTPREQIHLAACAPHQKAQEIEVDGKAVGAFTFALHEALIKGKKEYSYAELIACIRLRCQQFVQSQTPQLECLGLNPELKNDAFLQGALKTNKSAYHIFLDGDAGWKLNAGQMDAIGEKDTILLIDQQKEYKIGEIENTLTQVLGVEDLKASQIYPCTVQRFKTPLLKVFTTIKKTAKHKVWMDELAAVPMKEWSFAKNEKGATHFLVVDKNQIQCISKGTNHVHWNLGFGQTGTTMGHTIAQRLEQMGKYLRVLNTSNPHSFINLKEVGVQLQIQEPDDTGQLSPLKKVPFLENIICKQISIGESTFAPYITLDISNNSNIPLWASVQILSPGFDPTLKCSTQYSITNRFMQQEMLMPGETKNLIDFFEGVRYKTIPLQISEDYIARISPKASFFLKIWISTDPFDTDRMNQPGIPIIDHYVPSSGTAKSLDPYEPDWQTFTAAIEVSSV